MQTKVVGRQKFVIGIIQFLWAELLTMNLTKLKSLSKIISGLILIKLSKRKRAREQNRELQKLAERSLSV